MTSRIKIFLCITHLFIVFSNGYTRIALSADIAKNAINTEHKYQTRLSKTNTVKTSPKKLPIYDGKFKLGWTAKTWNGLIFKEKKGPDEKRIISIMVSEKTKPWSGIKIAPFLGINSITVNKELKENSSFVFFINGGEDIFGTHSGEQEILISLENSSKVKEYLRLNNINHIKKIRLQKHISGQRIDNNPDTWQRVEIPLKIFSMLNHFTDTFDTILIQFRGAPPKTGINISKIQIDFDHYSQKKAVKQFGKLIYNTDIEFPDLEDIDPDLLMPRNSTVSIDKHGNFIVNGRPRFMIGAQTTGEMGRHWKHTSGYADKYNWLYDKIPDYESSQRIGLDSMGLFIPPAWARKYYPDNRKNWIETDAYAVSNFIRNIQLPLYVDLTGSTWGHGILGNTSFIPKSAQADSNKSHFLFYSITHPEGIKLYKEFWRYSVHTVLNSNGYPLFYELFNEPAFNDDSEYNRKLFIKYLREKYENIDILNNTWRSNYNSFKDIATFKKRTDNPGLYIDFGKFLEDEFTKLCLIGQNIIKDTDKRKEARVAFQPDVYRDISRSNINPYKVNKFMDVIIASTGGGLSRSEGISSPVTSSIQSSILSKQLEEGILMVNNFRNLARYKPLLDGEFTGTGGPYRSTDKKKLLNDIWLEAARGYNAIYLFSWKKDSYLDPSKVPTDALLSIMDFKKELRVVEDLLITRPRNVTKKIALLLSYPTERLSAIRNNSMHNEILTYAGALEFSHWPYEVILEEHFPEGRLSDYKVLITAGVRNIYPESIKYLEEFIREGGILIMGTDLPGFDEYDNILNWGGIEGLKLGDKIEEELKVVDYKYSNWKLLPGKINGVPYRDISANKEWKAIGSIDTRNFIFQKKYGKGTIYYIGVRMSEYPLASILGSFLSKSHASRELKLTDYQRGDLCPNIEVHSSNRKNKKTFYFYNWDSYSKLCYIKSNMGAYERYYAFDPLSNEEYDISEKGVLLYLPPHDKRILVLSEDGWQGQNIVFVINTEIVNQYITAREKEEMVLSQTNKEH